MFPEINDRFEELRNKRRPVVAISDAKEEKIAELRNEVERLREQNRLLALEIHRIGQQILEERERADRMTVYERQNASLREEISRIQAGGGTPLKVVASMKINQLSGRERGEENLAKVRRYLAGLKADRANRCRYRMADLTSPPLPKPRACSGMSSTPMRV